jgi:HSP20 family protein
MKNNLIKISFMAEYNHCFTPEGENTFVSTKSNFMSLVKTNRFSLPSVFSDFFDADRFFGQNTLLSEKELQLPAVNVTETDKAFKLELAVPGYKKEEIKVHVEQDVLTISAEKQEEKKESHEKYTRREFSYGSFARTFQLPKGTQHDGISARYENGLMTLSIPKSGVAPGTERKQISIA